MAVSHRDNYHLEFSGKRGKAFQFNSWQSVDVAQTLIELEGRLGSEWYLRFENCRDKRIDYVLVYKNDDDNVRREARERFEERLAKDGLELLRWKKQDCWSLNDSDHESDEMFVLIHTPFDRLALECQSVKMDMPLKGQKCPRYRSLLNSLETDEEGVCILHAMSCHVMLCLPACLPAVLLSVQYSISFLLMLPNSFLHQCSIQSY
jgi:hypothetical protein